MVQKSKYDATADADRVIVERVAEIAAERGIPRVQVALAWLRKTTGYSTYRWCDQNFASRRCNSALSVNLTPEEIASLKSRMYLTGLWARYNPSRPNHHKENT